MAGIFASGKYSKPALEKFLLAARVRKDGLNEREYKARLQRIAAFKDNLAVVFNDNKLDALTNPLQKRLWVPATELNQADRNGIIAGLTGYPAIDVPAGFSTQTETAPLGVPVGMDLLGRPFDEGHPLGLAYAYEQATGPHRLPASKPSLAQVR